MLFIILPACLSARLMGQDNESPVSPRLELVTVEAATGFTHLYWSPGGSPDVAGYVIYLYDNGFGEAVDTVYNPLATDYLHTKTYAANYSVDYVIAAIDSSENVSPLSNPLSTIFLESRLDTCNHTIILSWNNYPLFPDPVTGYSVYLLIDGGQETFAGDTEAGITSFLFTDIETERSYCFRLEAILEGGSASSSNSSCIETDIIKPPAWINADYSIIRQDNMIELSFSYDPESEIELFRLEESQVPQGPYTGIADINDNDGEITAEGGYLEDSARYFRLAAINYCGNAVTFSNIITASPLYTSINQGAVDISWNPYMEYNGELSEYRVYRIINGQRVFLSALSSADTVYRDMLDNFIYVNNEEKICYQVEALEINNPFTGNGVSISQAGCTDTPVGIFVPNAFTPDGDLLNEYFAPVLTFTPKKYRLFVKTRVGVTVFSTSDYLEPWDGTFGGKALQPGVYLWFIHLTTPGGREITRNGTVTIIFN